MSCSLRNSSWIGGGFVRRITTTNRILTIHRFRACRMRQPLAYRIANNLDVHHFTCPCFHTHMVMRFSGAWTSAPSSRLSTTASSGEESESHRRLSRHKPYWYCALNAFPKTKSKGQRDGVTRHTPRRAALSSLSRVSSSSLSRASATPLSRASSTTHAVCCRVGRPLPRSL